MAGSIFPSDDMSGYRISAPPLISEEEEDSLFKKKKDEKKKDKTLAKEDKKTNELIIKKKLLQKYGIVNENASLEDVDIDLHEIVAYALLKKDFLKPALQILGVPDKKEGIQKKSNILFRFLLNMPNVDKKLSPSIKNLSLRTEKIEDEENKLYNLFNFKKQK